MRTLLKTGLVGAAALVLALSGCSSDGTTAADSSCTGKWELSGMEQDGQPASAEDLDALKELGVEFHLDLSASGDMTFTVLGESLSGQWSQPDATTCDLTVDGQTLSARLDGDKLHMEDDASKMIFDRVK